MFLYCCIELHVIYNMYVIALRHLIIAMTLFFLFNVFAYQGQVSNIVNCQVMYHFHGDVNRSDYRAEVFCNIFKCNLNTMHVFTTSYFLKIFSLKLNILVPNTILWF